MKLCKDCKHIIVPENADKKYSRCNYNQKISMVTGEPEETELLFCFVSRESIDPLKCGAEARFFEPKQPDENGVTHSGVRFLKGETYV